MLKKITYTLLISSSLCSAMDIQEKLAWTWVNFWYPSKTKEANKACAEVDQLLHQLRFMSVRPEDAGTKNRLLEGLSLCTQICERRQQARSLTKIPEREKFIRQGDYHFLKGFYLVKDDFNILKFNNKSDQDGEQ